MTTAEDFFKKGNEEFARGNYQQAINDYLSSLKINPASISVYNNCGLAHSKLNQYNRAIEWYNIALFLDHLDHPEKVSIYVNRGFAHHKLNQHTEAIDDFKKAICINPSHLSAYNLRAEAHHRLKQYNSAINDYTISLNLNPKDAIIYNNRGTVYADFGLYIEAIQDYNEALQLDPKLFIVYYNRGNSHRGLKEYPLALEDYNKALKLNPKHALSYYKRAITTVEINSDIASQHNDYIRFLHLDNGDEEIESIFNILLHFKEYSDVTMMVQRIVERVPQLTDIIRLQDYVETSLARTQPFEDFFMYRQSDNTQRDYLLSRALVNYFLGDEGTAFDLIDNQIDRQEKQLRYSENYYHALSARLFGKIYGITAGEIWEGWDECLSAENPTEIYYLAWHHWLLGEESKAIELAQQNKAFLPALYQLLLFTRDDSLIQEIKDIESDLSDEQGFLDDFSRRIHPNDDDYLSKFLDYAHYAELEEAIRMVDPDHRTKTLDQAIDIDFLQLRDDLVKEQADQLLKTIYEEKEEWLQSTDSEALGDEITELHKYLTHEFEHILEKSKTISSQELEKELAQFIHAWDLEEKLDKSRMKSDPVRFYEKVIRYFHVTKRIDLLTYTMLFYYIHRRNKILHRNIVGVGSEESLVYLATEFIKIIATATPAALLTLFNPTLLTFIGGIAATYLGKISISKVVKLMNRANFSKRNAQQDYTFFKKFFLENTIEEILKVKTEGFVNSQTYAQLNEYYEANKYILKRQK